MNCEKLVGYYFGEVELLAWLAELQITEKPELVGGDDTTYLSNPEKGIELTFRCSESIKKTDREYPEGALVLSNIRYYGIQNDEYQPYKEKLPLDVSFGEKRSELVQKFGNPEWTNPSGKKMRWNVGTLLVLALFDDADRMEIFSLQLPT